MHDERIFRWRSLIVMHYAGRRPQRLSEVYARPVMEGKRNVGELEIHQNGLRYQSSRSSQKIGQLTYICLRSLLHIIMTLWLILRYTFWQHQAFIFSTLRQWTYCHTTYTPKESYHYWQEEDESMSNQQCHLHLMYFYWQFIVYRTYNSIVRQLMCNLMQPLIVNDMGTKMNSELNRKSVEDMHTLIKSFLRRLPRQ